MFAVLLFALCAPPEVTPGKPGEQVAYAATINVSVGEVAFVNGKGNWFKLPESPGTLIPTPTGAAFVAPSKGNFTILCTSADGIAFVKIVVGDAVVPPAPDDFKDKLLAAAKKDNDKASIVQLSAFYSAQVGQKIAQDTTLTTVAQVMAKVRVSAVLDASKVPATRQVIGAALSAQFKPDDKLTDATRKALVDFFAKVESILDLASN